MYLQYCMGYIYIKYCSLSEIQLYLLSCILPGSPRKSLDKYIGKQHFSAHTYMHNNTYTHREKNEFFLTCRIIFLFLNYFISVYQVYKGVSLFYFLTCILCALIKFTPCITLSNPFSFVHFY
jgi:hypothetical protein